MRRTHRLGDLTRPIRNEVGAHRGDGQGSRVDDLLAFLDQVLLDIDQPKG